MEPQALILRQFAFGAGDKYIAYEQTHDQGTLDAYADLPFIYCITFVKKSSNTSIPMGGFFFKTNLKHDAPGFQSLVFDAASAVEPSSGFLATAQTYKPTLIGTPDGSPFPTELAMDAFTLEEYTKLATSGHA